MNLPQTEPIKQGDDIAILTTNKGVIKIRFFGEYAPKAVENFLTHSKNGYYKDVIFHRVIDGFVMQGGDPTGTGRGGKSIWGTQFDNEVDPCVRHIRGAVAMANAGPDTNGSQFYIVQAKQIDGRTADRLKGYLNTQDEPYGKSKDGTPLSVKDVFPPALINQYLTEGGLPSLDFSYTVFGQVYEGLDVVDAITKSETNRNDKPLVDVVIENVEVGTYTEIE